DRVMQRLAGLPVPQDRGLALVRDADRHEIGERDVRLAHRLARDIALRAKDLLRVVLDPAGLRKDLLELALRDRDGGAFLVEQDRARAGGALVESENVLHRKILLSTKMRACVVGLLIYGCAFNAPAGDRSRARAQAHAARSLRRLQARRRDEAVPARSMPRAGDDWRDGQEVVSKMV